MSPGLFAVIFMLMRGRSFGAVSQFFVDTFIDGFVVTKDFVSKFRRARWRSWLQPKT